MRALFASRARSPISIAGHSCSGAEKSLVAESTSCDQETAAEQWQPNRNTDQIYETARVEDIAVRYNPGLALGKFYEYQVQPANLVPSIVLDEECIPRKPPSCLLGDDPYEDENENAQKGRLFVGRWPIAHLFQENPVLVLKGLELASCRPAAMAQLCASRRSAISGCRPVAVGAMP